jgi:hypothetical protein
MSDALKKSPAKKSDAVKDLGERHSPDACFSMTHHRRPSQILPLSLQPSFPVPAAARTRNLSVGNLGAVTSRFPDVQLHI